MQVRDYICECSSLTLISDMNMFSVWELEKSSNMYALHFFYGAGKGKQNYQGYGATSNEESLYVWKYLGQKKVSCKSI